MLTQPSDSSGVQEPPPAQTLQAVEVLVLLFKPHMVRLRDFLWSLKHQQRIELRVVLVYDGTPAEEETLHLQNLVREFSFPLCSFQYRVGTYRHAERAMRLCLSGQNPFVVADQDDWWMPDRLEQQSKLLIQDNVSGVTSNAHVVVGGQQTRFLLFEILQSSAEALRYQLICNHITGTGTLFSHQILSNALPFPDAGKDALHDHWLGIVAVAMNGVTMDEIPRWLYVQHESNQLGVPTSRSKVIVRLIWKLLKVVKGLVTRRDQYISTVNCLRSVIVSRRPQALLTNSYLMALPAQLSSSKGREKHRYIHALKFSRLEAIRFFV